MEKSNEIPNKKMHCTKEALKNDGKTYLKIFFHIIIFLLSFPSTFPIYFSFFHSQSSSSFPFENHKNLYSFLIFNRGKDEAKQMKWIRNVCVWTGVCVYVRFVKLLFLNLNIYGDGMRSSSSLFIDSTGC